MPKEAPVYNLIDVLDHQLDEDQLKEKRRQKLMKAGADARLRAKAEKEAERARQASGIRCDSFEVAADPYGGMTHRRKRPSVMTKPEQPIPKLGSTILRQQHQVCYISHRLGSYS